MVGFWDQLLPQFISLFLVSQRRSARLAAQRTAQQAQQAMAIDVTDVGNKSDAFSDDRVALSDVDLLPVPSCLVCEEHFAASGPLSRCPLAVL